MRNRRHVISVVFLTCICADVTSIANRSEYYFQMALHIPNTICIMLDIFIIIKSISLDQNIAIAEFFLDLPVIIGLNLFMVIEHSLCCYTHPNE